MKILVTGGAGFIGSALVRYLINHTNNTVINFDKLTYAANLLSLEEVNNNERYFFFRGDLASLADVQKAFLLHSPDAIMHLAAESHVDRSINNPAPFIESNIIGTYHLLETARKYWHTLTTDQKAIFRFHHISTDEVFGDLNPDELAFTENNPYKPSSPYSASKASSDHLVRAWYKTYNLPILVTNCSNNYGPYQFPEKLIPVMILNALQGKPLSIYGRGHQIRDWLYVDDHVQGLYQVLTKGTVGETYNIGGNNEKTNIEVVESICKLLEELVPVKPQGVKRYKDLIKYIQDRPGHDQRYAINANKIKQNLNWCPRETFETGLRKTVEWYIENNSIIHKKDYFETFNS